jgi:uncharacterized protein (TIGR00369 family)
MTQTQSRSRTFEWTDPAEHAAHVRGMSGLEVLQAMAVGDLPAPPVLQMLGITGFAAAEGGVTVRLVPQEFHYNPLGSVHGGVISALLDTAAACSVHSTLPTGVGYTSLDLSVKFLRPVTLALGEIVATGAVLQRGRRTALAEARLTDAAGKLLAHATSTCMIFEVTAGR